MIIEELAIILQVIINIIWEKMNVYYPIQKK